MHQLDDIFNAYKDNTQYYYYIEYIINLIYLFNYNMIIYQYTYINTHVHTYIYLSTYPYIYIYIIIIFCYLGGYLSEADCGYSWSWCIMIISLSCSPMYIMDCLHKLVLLFDQSHQPTSQWRPIHIDVEWHFTMLPQNTQYSNSLFIYIMCCWILHPDWSEDNDSFSILAFLTSSFNACCLYECLCLYSILLLFQ